MGLRAKFIAELRQLDWARGLRAGLAVAVSMAICHALRLPMSWSALGAFEGNIVDNGGPYRTRFASIAMLMGPGALGAILASIASPYLGWALLLTAIFAFVVIYLRAAGQHFNTSSVIILVVYFVGLDHPATSLAAALDQAELFIGGCACAAVLSLFLWPVYPFRHAQLSIAACYGVLAQSLSEIKAALSAPDIKPDDAAWRTGWFRRAHRFPSRMRRALETARGSLGGVRARTPARTLRGRNLAVLLETADILFSPALVLIELAERSLGEGGSEEVEATQERLSWIAQLAQLIEQSLQEPSRLEEVERAGAEILAAARPAALSANRFAVALQAVQEECTQNFQTAFEALPGSLSSGRPASVDPLHKPEQRLQFPGTLDLLRQNWTFTSSAMRHALRSAFVCVASVLLMRTLHVPYGEWMALTAVIVLQPYAIHTWRKGVQRVGGTVAGGVLAAALAVFIRSPQALIAAVCITSFFTLAWYAVDYAWYCFFLTPTFVLLTLHGRHGWGVAGIRAMDTLLGAALAVIAAKLLWTESEHLHLADILARSASANATYLAATRRYWSASLAMKAADSREILASARRAAGLANTESEEALERLMMENNRAPGSAVRLEHALSFATYARRLTQSITTVALLHPLQPGSDWEHFVDDLGARLRHTVALLQGEQKQPSASRATLPLGEEQGMAVRLRRQVEVLEKSALILEQRTQQEPLADPRGA